MAFNKRLFVGSADDCTTETVDIFGDSSGVALWSLDYDASETGGNFDGTVLGNVDFGKQGKINWGIQPQGANATDCIQLPANLSASLPTTSNLKNFAISMWVKSNATDLNAATGSNALFVNFNGSYQYIGFGGNINGNFPTGKLFYYTYGGSGFHNSWIITPSSYADDEWHHLVITDTYLNTTALRTRRIYVDNTLIVSDSVDKYFYSLTSTTPFIGGTNGNNAGCKANIDQVRIFNRDLTTAERTTLYQETACVHTATTNNINYPTTNLAYYKMDNSAEDSHSNTYDATPTQINYKFGRYGQAASFASDSSFFNTGLTDSNLGTSYSVSLWAYADVLASGSDYYSIIGKYYTGSGNLGYILSANSSGVINFFGYFGNQNTTGTNFNSSQTFKAGIYHHIVLVFDGSTEVRLYVDNVKTTQSVSSTINQNSVNLMIGSADARTAVQRNFIGNIDQVRVFATALSDSQVTSLFNEKQAYITKNASNPFGDGNELAFYKMENNANDSTGSNNGTNYGATFTTTDALFGTYSASFDGSNDYIQTSLSLDAAANTVSFWFNADSVGSQNPALYFNNRGGRIDITINGTGSNTPTVSGGNILINSTTAITEWNFVCVVFTGWASSYSAGSSGSAITAKVYLNGNLLSSLSPTPYGQSDGLRIGRSGGGYYYDGLIDQVRIFDRALEGDEVFKLYAEVIN